jgi:hypothetical protein
MSFSCKRESCTGIMENEMTGIAGIARNAFKLELPLGEMVGPGGTAALKAWLAERLGSELEVRLLSPESSESGRFWLEIGGHRVAAEGRLPVGAAESLWVRLESLEPQIRLQLLDAGNQNRLPASLRRGLAGLLQPGSRPADYLAWLGDLIETGVAGPRLSKLQAALCKQLHQLFSLENLVAGLDAGRGLPLAELGLFDEAGLAGAMTASLAAAVGDGEGGNLAALATGQTSTGKGLLQQLLAVLSPPPSGDLGSLEDSAGVEVRHLRQALTGLRDNLEFNQLLNNPGLNPDGDLRLVLPFWGFGETTDLWLRFSGGEPERSGGRFYTVMLYLDFSGLGPIGVRVVAAPGERFEAELLVVSDSASAALKGLLPAAAARLRPRFGGGARFFVSRVSDESVDEFRRRAWLANLPPLLQTAG